MIWAVIFCRIFNKSGRTGNNAFCCRQKKGQQFNKRPLKKQKFCVIRQPAGEELRTRGLFIISEDWEPAKMKAAGKVTVLQRSLIKNSFALLLQESKSF